MTAMATTAKRALASKREILELCKKQGVNFLRLQFTDILGINKNVEVPESQFAKALEGDIMFDGSSIEGFVRIEESDMMLRPDLTTFRVLPYDDEGGRVARLICDIYNPDGSAFAGCTRQALGRQIARAEALGYEMMAGVEAEFFIFQLDAGGDPTTLTHDKGGYFDQTPVDKAEEIRRLIIKDLVSMGFEVEAGHHEVAPGQHEIDFRYTAARETADNLATFRFIVRNVAYRHGFLATFMPKPIFGQNGSGMHTHQSLFKHGKNAFHDPKGNWELSDTALHYVAGLLRHARGFCAVTNPLVNSYKRLVPGFEAPTNVAWSMRNRSPLIRIPHRRGIGTRCELRMPDPSANPYLALAVQLAAGLDGIERKLVPPDPVNKNIFTMSFRERRRYRIDELPRDLHEALEVLEKDDVVRDALGPHIYERFVEAKREEWQESIGQVSAWELDRYLGQY
ncbi:MAG TPA: type I glutamate--ammonia ligase [Gemmatimonadales bacterium]|jgi:glutamine synthetase|nr:type I glutamate--ammonia ligase [Gemmatimonadales bacterium]